MMRTITAVLIVIMTVLTAQAVPRNLTDEEQKCYAAAQAFARLPFADEAVTLDDDRLFFPKDSYFYRRPPVFDEYFRLSTIVGHKRGFVHDYPGFPELIEIETRAAENAWENKLHIQLEALIERALACKPASEELTS